MLGCSSAVGGSTAHAHAPSPASLPVCFVSSWGKLTPSSCRCPPASLSPANDFLPVATLHPPKVIIDSVKDAACSSSSARQGIAPARVARPVVVPAGTTPAAN